MLVQAWKYQKYQKLKLSLFGQPQYKTNQHEPAINLNYLEKIPSQTVEAPRLQPSPSMQAQNGQAASGQRKGPWVVLPA